MATRKVFSSAFSKKELSYQINSSGELDIKIYMEDGTIVGIALEKNDAIQFIQELNKIRKELK